jgi:hypothetical protein
MRGHGLVGQEAGGKRKYGSDSVRARITSILTSTQGRHISCHGEEAARGESFSRLIRGRRYTFVTNSQAGLFKHFFDKGSTAKSVKVW